MGACGNISLIKSIMAQKVCCPKCGYTNVGTSTAYKLKKGATYAADFALGYIEGRTGVDVTSETGSVSDNVKIEKEYECKICGYTWKGEVDENDNRYPSQDRELYKKVVYIIADNLYISANEITPNTYLSDLGIDSLDAVELVMKFENQFNISIPLEDAGTMVQVQDIVNYLKRYF